MRLFVLLACFVSVFAHTKDSWYSAVVKDGVWSLLHGKNLGVASGKYVEGRYETGWDEIEVEGNSGDDYQQAFGMGYVEGALTVEVIYDTYRNFYLNSTNPGPKTLAFIKEQDQWVRSMAKQSTDLYWKHVALILAQMDGLYAGYSAFSKKSISYNDFLYYIQLTDETGDIATAVGEAVIPSISGEIMLSKDPATHPIIGSHCSAMFKATEGGVIGSHATWSGFNSMLRLYKHWNTKFSVDTASSGISFSGYPGMVASQDDWYMTSAGLTITETTNEVFNLSLFQKYVVPETVPYWIRVTVAARLSNTGPEWMKYFAEFNSGTYSNQWMVLDNKLAVSGSNSAQPAYTFVVGEQIPGMVYWEDQSTMLSNGKAWVSFNVPFYPIIYNLSGYPAMYEKYGNMYSHDNCARGQIFARDHKNVVDVDSLKYLMRYNKYQTDPLSLQDACRGISARCDLGVPWTNPTNLNVWSAFGATDCKVLPGQSRGLKRSCDAISGPTYVNQPPFMWTDTWSNVAHFGQPDLFNFNFEVMEPSQ